VSRAPTAAARAAPEPAAEPRPPVQWSLIADQVLHQQVVFVTADPEADDAGVLAKYYSRRRHVDGRWQPASEWVDPASLKAIEPQPTHWRPDPSRELLAVPVA
jgi:hypothetical protein